MQFSPFSQNLLIERPRIFPRSVVAGVTLRNAETFGGAGFSPLKAQALAEEEAERHRAYLAEYLGVKRELLIFQKQTHGTLVRQISANDCGKEGYSFAPFEESDGIATREAGLIVCAGVADCAAVLLYDARTQAVAAVHSGWKGTRDNIVAHALRQMNAWFGSQAADVFAYVSPCASGERYRVRKDVAQYFSPPALRQITQEEYTFDNRLRIREQLIAESVREECIEIAEGCTIADERYHSHRRDGAKAGRMIAFIGAQSA
jgi:YfiH family protein